MDMTREILNKIKIKSFRSRNKFRIQKKEIYIYFVLITIFYFTKLCYADTRTKYIYIFGGFPDIRFQGGGIVHPNSEMNPATLEISQKYDINLSAGLSKYKSVLAKITDKSTSVIGGGLYFKCISEKFLCSGENTNILSGDISYSFNITDILVGAGLSIKWKTNNGFESELGKKTTIAGLGTIFKKDFEKISLLGGFSSFLFYDDLAGGLGIGVISEDFFSFTQIFYIEKKLIPAAGIITRALNWFRLFASYHLDLTGGIAFISPRLYIWTGYSTISKGKFLINIGIIL